MKAHSYFFFLITTLFLLTVHTGLAEEKTFVIDNAQSSLTLSGSLSTPLGPVQMVEQDTGSLTTTYSGAIRAEVTGDSVAFVGGSAIAAGNSGDWQPALGGEPGVAPANYGATGGNFAFTGYAALRNLLFDLTSDSITMLNGTFAADSLEFSFPESATSTADYVVSGLLNKKGSEALAGRATNDVLTAATIASVGDQLILTIPVDYMLILTNDLPAQFRVVGQIIATASSAAPLMVGNLEVTPGNLSFTIATMPGKTYTILGSTDLFDFSTVIDQFTATETQTSRDIAITLLDQQFFILREE